MDIGLNLLELELGASPTAAAFPSVPVPTPLGAETTYTFIASDMSGGNYGEMPDAKLIRITWTLDGMTQAEFDIPIDNSSLANLPLPNASTTPPREIQIYRNGHLLFWGPVVSRRCDSKERVWHYTAYDPLWYLSKRNMGQAERKNYLVASSFDSSMDGFTAVGGVSDSIDNTRYLIGGGSLRLSCASSGENFCRKLITVTSGSLGLALFLTAWVYVDSITAPAYARRGAFLGRVGAVGPGAYGFSIVDQSTPLGSWQRMSCHVNMPPNTTEVIDTRLYCPDGVVHWDGVTLTVQESLSFVVENSPGGGGWDQTLIARKTCDYLSGALAVGSPYTKSNVQLHTAGDASGITKERTYPFTDHQPGYEGGVGSGALDEWTRAEQGFDFRVDNDSSTIRTFRTYYPFVGQTWAEPFAYINTYDFGTGEPNGSNWGIVGYEWMETIEGSATDVAEISSFGDDSGREEGSFMDDDALGGLTLELVEAAPTAAPLDLLDAVAKQRGTQLAKPISTPVLTMVEPRDPDTHEIAVTLIGALLPGDFIPVTILDGTVLMFSVPRVTQVTFEAEDESLKVAIDA